MQKQLLACCLTMLAVSTEALASPSPYFEPITSRYGSVKQDILVDATFTYFRDKSIQEADHFDGRSFLLEATIPLWSCNQLYFALPVYTEGHANSLETGQRFNIEGYGGILDFTTLIYEHQLWDETAHFANVSVGIGGGFVLNDLDTSIGDDYNHSGNMGALTLNADNSIWDDRLHWFGNVYYRHYFKSDDLNPSGGNDSFSLTQVSTAVVHKSLHQRIKPALELLYQGTSGYHALYVDPQVMFPVSDFFEVKLGGGLGLTSDADDYQLNAQLTLHL